MSRENQLSLVIPCFNEEGSIPELVAQAKEMLLRLPGEVIFVDNGSSDSTSRLLREAIDGHSGIRIVSLMPNCGYGGAIKAGLRVSQHRFVGWTHADLQFPLVELERAHQIMVARPEAHNHTLVKGRRLGRHRRKAIVSGLMSVIVLLTLNRWLPDSNAVPVITTRKILDFLDEAPNNFDFELFVFWRASLLNYAIYRVPFFFHPRAHGVSSWDKGFFAQVTMAINLFRSMRNFSERTRN